MCIRDSTFSMLAGTVVGGAPARTRGQTAVVAAAPASDRSDVNTNCLTGSLMQAAYRGVRLRPDRPALRPVVGERGRGRVVLPRAGAALRRPGGGARRWHRPSRSADRGRGNP